MSQIESDMTRQQRPANASLVGKTKVADPELELVWIEYKESGDQQLKNKLLENYLHEVRRVADRLYMKLPQQVDKEDLYSAGLFGLMDSIEKYDLTREVKFESYCSTRINGSILDSLRKQDWVPRLVRSTANRLDRAWMELQNLSGREPTDFEMAEHLGVTDDEYETMQREAAAASVMSISEQISDDGESRALRKIDVLHDKKAKAPDQQFLKTEIKDFILNQLEGTEQAIIFGYYIEGLTMKKIGETLNLSESRVCQLHSRVMTRLRQTNAKHRLDFMQE